MDRTYRRRDAARQPVGGDEQQRSEQRELESTQDHRLPPLRALRPNRSEREEQDTCREHAQRGERQRMSRGKELRRDEVRAPPHDGRDRRQKQVAGCRGVDVHHGRIVAQIYLDIKINSLDVKITTHYDWSMDRVERILEQWRRERPDLELRPMGVIGRLKRIAHRLDHGMSRTFRDHGLNLSSFDVLATLRRAGEPYELSPGDLLATSMVTSGTMTNRIDQLEEAGLVERRENPTDGRSVLIRLTADGLTVIADALSDHVATQTRLTSGLSDAELTRLDRLLRRFLIALEGDAEEPTR